MVFSFFSYPLHHGFGYQLSVIWWGMIGAGFCAILAIGMHGMLFVFIILFSQQERLHSICLQLHEIDFLSKGCSARALHVYVFLFLFFYINVTKIPRR